MENACCAHMRVSYRTRVSRPGLVVEAWWECNAGCGQRFALAATLAALFDPHCPFCGKNDARKSDNPRGWTCPHCHPEDAPPEPTEEMVDQQIKSGPDAAPFLSKDEEARLASILVPALKVSPGPHAEPPEEVCRWCGFEKNEHLTTDGTRFRCPARFYEPLIAYTEGDKQQS